MSGTTQQNNWRERLAYGSDRETERQRQQERQQALTLRNRRTGINLFQASWIMAFICLIVVNLQIRANSPAWPSPGVQKLDPILPTLATIGLLVSVVLTSRALRALQTDDLKSFLIQWRATLWLDVFFIAVLAFEWLTLKPVPEEVILLLGGVQLTAATTLYNNIFLVMTGFHAFHAIVIGGYMIWVQRRAITGVYGSHESWDAEAGAKLWYFVVVAWIMFYTVLYLL